MKLLKRLIKAKKFKQAMIVSFFIVSAIIYFGYQLYRQYYISTDDAYINANIVQVAPRISGKIVALHITNNQHVKSGQPLFDIDPEPYQLAINSALAQLNFSSAELENAARIRDRTISLVSKNFSSQQAGDTALANYKTAAARVEQAKAELAQANLNLAYTKVTADTSGQVTNVTLNVGDIVQANQPLFSLISDKVFWADANFKETEMADIKPKQSATIITDLYPQHTFDGVVESIGGGTGSVFSLLPPQNATGNWVKVTQRVPIRVRILNPDSRYPLPIGISATVTINLQSQVDVNNE